MTDVHATTFRYKTSELGPLEVRTQQSSPKGIVFVFRQSEPPHLPEQSLVEDGFLVISVDTDDALKHLDSDSNKACLYLPGPLESISRNLQSEFHFPQYHAPSLVGRDAGAALVYAAILQAPPLAFGGGASIDFDGRLALRRSLCNVRTRLADNEQIFEPNQPFGAPWYFAATRPVPPNITAFTSAELTFNHQDFAEIPVTPDVAVLYQKVVSLMASDRPDGVSDLPVVEVSAESPRKVLALIVSGDGGWRDLDQSLGALLKDRGFAVLGLDALRYFWAKRTPEELSRDIQRILAYYSRTWSIDQFILVGYSFGADILPFVYNRLPDETKSRIRFLSLLAPDRDAEFEIHVLDWVSSSVSDEARPVLAEIEQIPPAKLQCIYGMDEAGVSLCTAPEMQAAERIVRPGAHHFDYRYEILADAIVSGLITRSVDSADKR